MARSTEAPNVETVSEDGWNTVVEPYPDSWTPTQVGETIVGVYASKKTITQDGLDGKPREVDIYTIVKNDGEKVAVWGSYAIDLAFELIGEGQEVRIKYEGTKPINNGAQSVKTFTVQTR